MKKILLLLFLAVPSVLPAQTEFETYNWNTMPAPADADTAKSVNGAAVNLERRIFEIYLNPESYFEEMFVFHKKTKVESHQAVSGYNKIYISLKNVIEIINIQARFIAPNGKITDLPKESIKQIDNLDNKGDYKTFAIEGAEVGGQIEYFYVLRRKFDPYSGYYIQDDVPKSNVEIVFSYPSKMKYQIKTYNGLPPFTVNTDNAEKTRQRSFAPYIPAVEEEEYSTYKADLMRFEYCFTHNLYNSTLRRYSWNTGCENIYANAFSLSKSDVSAAQSLYKQILPRGQAGTDEKVRAIENWIKTNLTIDKDIPAEPDLESILKTKQVNTNSVIKLFAAVLQAAGVRFELVTTGDKTDQPFDPEFNCGNFLVNFLFYFPETDSYLVPDQSPYRMGLIPPQYQGEYALFMRPVSYGNLNSLAYQVRNIPLQDYRLNSDTMIIDLKLDENEDNIHATVHRIMHGELGMSFQNAFSFLPDDKKKEIAETIFRMSDQNSQIVNQKQTNAEPNSVAVKPFIWDVSLLAGNLIENAGNDLIFRIGETIGQQSELYQQKSRKFAINIGLLHNYHRRITFEIPAGYRVVNPENLNMNIVMKNGDDISCTFKSEAKIEGNKIVVLCDEYYKDEHYPAERYNEFRQVINAAADFNKKTILLKKI